MKLGDDSLVLQKQDFVQNLKRYINQIQRNMDRNIGPLYKYRGPNCPQGDYYKCKLVAPLYK